MTTEQQPPFRLAFRTEGTMVNCYVAAMDTMAGAHLLGCMPRVVLVADESIWEDWKRLMERAMVPLCRSVFGSEPSHWEEHAAPEHERGGSS